MDYIDKHLASGALNTTYLPSIRASMLIGKRLLNKYYNMTDYSEVYRIAMGKFIFLYSQVSQLMSVHSVLDPKRKLDYFRSAGWEEEWIETAREIVEEEFDRGYAGMSPELEEPEAASVRHI